MELIERNPFSLEGRVALVTGAASGIGAGIARVLAEAGAMVVIADIKEGMARRLADELIDQGLRADAFALDVECETSIIEVCRAVLARHGAPWVVVNNAGIQDREVIELETVESWDRIQAVNTRGPFMVTREFGKIMAETGQGGRFVNIGSAVLAGMLTKGAAAYTASKGGLAAFSSIAALEYAAHGITVNTILPGGVLTPGTQNAKGPPSSGPGTRRPCFGLCEPHDIGFAVLYLASPAARMVSNQIFAIDGGFSLS